MKHKKRIRRQSLWLTFAALLVSICLVVCIAPISTFAADEVSESSESESFIEEDDSMQEEVVTSAVVGDDIEPGTAADTSVPVAAPAASPVSLENAITVNNESSLRQAVEDAPRDGTPCTILVSSDIELAGTIEIPNGADIILTASNGVTITVAGDYRHILVENDSSFTLDTGITLDGSGYNGGVLVEGGAFTMNGGCITGNVANAILAVNLGENTANGGGVYVTSGAFVMNGGVITENSARYQGGGVYVSTAAAFDMQGGSIENNTALFGGGVYLTTGSLDMDGGDIKNNTAFQGGGIYVTMSGLLTLNNGKIHNNQASEPHGDNEGHSGAGVYMGSGTFDMNGGSIYENEVPLTGSKAQNSQNNGGGVYVGSATFTMNAGEIRENTTHYSGGGVYLSGRMSNFNLKGGSICGNDAQRGGGLSTFTGSTATIAGGCIETNTAGSGGGVFMSGNNTTLAMSDGSISDNAAGNGGGVYINSGGTFNLDGGNVQENTATNGGGGVYAYGAFNLWSGNVSGNTSDGHGGGVYLNSNGSLQMHGGIVRNNTAALTGGGAYTGVYSRITVTGGSFSGNKAETGAYAFDMLNTSLLATYEAQVDGLESLSHPFDLQHTSESRNKAYNNYDINYTDGTLLVPYVITYDANFPAGSDHSGTAPEDDADYFADDVALAPGAGDMDVENHTFLGWATTDDVTEPNFSEGDPIVVTDDLTLYAVWQVNAVTYSVTYSAGAGSGNMTDSTNYGDSDTVQVQPNTLTAPSGHVFAGFIIEGGTGQVYAHASDNITGALSSFTISADTVLIAQWKQVFNTSYNPGTGSGTMTDTTKYNPGDTVAVKANTFTEPTGYLFAGFIVQGGSGQLYAHPDDNIADALPSFTIEADTVLIAQWERIAVVTYLPGEGTGTMEDDTQYRIGDVVEVLPNDFTGPEDMIFAGFIVKDGDGTVYAHPSDNVDGALPSITITDDMVLVPQWKVAPVPAPILTVMYNANFPSGSVASGQAPQDTNEYAVGDTLAVADAGTLKADGYTFIGWAVNPDSDSVDYTEGSYLQITESITLYAVWQLVSASSSSSESTSVLSNPDTSASDVAAPAQHYTGKGVQTGDSEFNILSLVSLLVAVIVLIVLLFIRKKSLKNKK